MLDEAATLLKAGCFVDLLGCFLEKLDGFQACRIEWTDAARLKVVRSIWRDRSSLFTQISVPLDDLGRKSVMRVPTNFGVPVFADSVAFQVRAYPPTPCAPN